ncbi:MAG: hypothetical protein EBR67_04200 [Proteobacteria bacterium]|nr:hypothetical protein [Pseudomonadota bacterium]
MVSAKLGGIYAGVCGVVDHLVLKPLAERRLEKTTNRQIANDAYSATKVVLNYKEYSEEALRIALNDFDQSPRMIFQDKNSAEILSYLKHISVDADLDELTRASAKNTLKNVLDVTRNLKDGSLILDILTDDGAAHLSALSEVLTDIDLGKETGLISKLFSAIPGRQGLLEKKVDAALKKHVAGGLWESGVVTGAKNLIAEELYKMFDDPVDFFYGNKAEERNAKHPELMRELRSKYADLALKAMPEAFMQAHKKDPEFSEIDKNPQSKIVAYFYQMLEAKPFTEDFNAAKDRALSSLKHWTNEQYELEHREQVLKNEEKQLSLRVDKGEGAALTHHQRWDGTNLTVSERLDIVQEDLALNAKDLAKHKLEFEKEIKAINAFFANLEKYTGNSALKNLLQFELFNATGLDNERRGDLVTALSPISEGFVNKPVATILTDNAAPLSYSHIEYLIVDKLKNRYAEMKFSQQELLTEKDKQESRLVQHQELLDTVSVVFNPNLDYSRLVEASSAFLELGKNTDDKNATALGKSLLHSSQENIRIEKLVRSINQGLLNANVLDQDGNVHSVNLAGRSRKDIAEYLNHIDEVALAASQRDDQSHLLQDLMELKKLLKDDKQAYSNESELLAGSIIYQAKDRKNMESLNQCLSKLFLPLHFNVPSIELNDGMLNFSDDTSTQSIMLSNFQSKLECTDASSRLELTKAKLGQCAGDTAIFAELEKEKGASLANLTGLYASNLTEKAVALKYVEPEEIHEAVVKPFADSVLFVKQDSGVEFGEFITALMQNLLHLAQELGGMFKEFSAQRPIQGELMA